MEIERHIEILLLSNDCVIVPGLGGFMAHHVDAHYDEHDGMFVPPIRTLGFNPQLTMNDSLLVQSYIEAYDMSYPEALRCIEDEVAELRQHLETEGEYELADIGMLRLNDEGHLVFTPCEAGILTPSLYGLSTFEMLPIDADRTEKAVAPVSGELPEEKAITIKMSWLRNAVAVAAAIIAFLMIGTPVSNSNKTATDMQQSSFINVTATSHRAAAQLADTPSPAVESEKELETLPAMPTDEMMPETDTVSETADTGSDLFCIVMASQVTERNANLFIDQLKEKGFYDARIEVSPTKVRRVVYGNYASEQEAAETLHQLRRESRLFKDTWIMEIK